MRACEMKKEKHIDFLFDASDSIVVICLCMHEKICDFFFFFSLRFVLLVKMTYLIAFDWKEHL